jgi:hypothetical protein
MLAFLARNPIKKRQNEKDEVGEAENVRHFALSKASRYGSPMELLMVYLIIVC